MSSPNHYFFMRSISRGIYVLVFLLLSVPTYWYTSLLWFCILYYSYDIVCEKMIKIPWDIYTFKQLCCSSTECSPIGIYCWWYIIDVSIFIWLVFDHKLERCYWECALSLIWLGIQFQSKLITTEICLYTINNVLNSVRAHTDCPSTSFSYSLLDRFTWKKVIVTWLCAHNS
jgi:hypothetical protein